MANSIRQWWPIPAFALGTGIGILIWNAPAGPAILQLLPPVGVALLAVLGLRDWFRQDRIGFVSVIGPAFVVALASRFAPPPWWSLTGAIPIVFLALFIFDSPARPWWWQHVLRRPLPNPAQVSDYRLGMALKAWSDELRGEHSPSEKRIAAAETALRRIRDVELPDADWAVLRDAYVDAGERRTMAARDGMDADMEARLQREFTILDGRRQEMRRRS